MFGRPKNEIELLRASLGGNTQAFGVLVGRYQSLVCAITYSATGSVERSEELAQEAFLKAWKNLSRRPKLPTAMLVVHVVDADGTIRSDVRLVLQGPLGAAEPFASTETGGSFVSVPGDHVLRVEAPGRAGAQKRILLKPRDTRADRPQILIVHLERQ